MNPIILTCIHVAPPLSGIEAGNRLLRIDGVRTSDLTMDEVTTLLRGPVGSSVELEVAGAQEGERPRWGGSGGQGAAVVVQRSQLAGLAVNVHHKCC